jgi:hypothetical protein
LALPLIPDEPYRTGAIKMSNDHTGNPLYPNLGPTVAKHRRLNDETPEGKKAYGQAVHAAIRALQRRELMSACSGFNPPRDVGAMSDSAFMASLRNATNTLRNVPGKVASEEDYYRALLKSRGVDAIAIEELGMSRGHSGSKLVLWLKAAWNVIKGKRGTPYLVEKVEPAPVAAPVVSRGRAALTRVVNKAIADGAPVYINQPAAPAPKRRGRPPGSKNRPKPVYSPGQQAAA